MAEETGKFLDLKAKTGVQTSETPTMFDHEKRSTSTLMISQTASRFTVVSYADLSRCGRPRLRRQSTFLATASLAAMAIWRTTAGVSAQA
jgi:hypothetical protein